ncbi:MAG: ribosome maturation factor RimP [Candidatus Bipolaricaulaceae bacterium]|nr:ribosome maturation factor RimP [Candidatus Bipolaricaulota bacterium]MCX7844198.1 ribosome maturation factor RimP [Candidatus Bipolaricaulota bacterium]MDW8152014.1 ribosome maturation factor RimP [Candidatus Bipolaricaulota bacterium]
MEVAKERIEAILRRGAELARVELYHWELVRAGRELRLVVYIDRESGVSVEDCARVSQILSDLLDEADPIPSSYVLEVSSPGLDRRLWEPWHYARAVGKKVHLKVQGLPRSAYEGRLLRVEEGKVVVEERGHPVEIPLDRVRQAWVVYEGE